MLRNHTEKQLSDKDYAGLVSGTAALDIQTVVPGKKKFLPRQKRKKEGQIEVTYSELPSDKPEPSEPLTLLPPPPDSQQEAALREEGVHRTPVLEMVPNADQDTKEPAAEAVSSGTDGAPALSETGGIIYEIAEELYQREKTAAEIEALDEPPFRKIFDRRQLSQLNRRARQRVLRLLELDEELAGPSDPSFSVPPEERPLKTSAAFWTQLVLMLPLVNLCFALLVSFRKKTNRSLRAYTRAFLIRASIVSAAALVLAAVFFMNYPAMQPFLHKVTALFHT